MRALPTRPLRTAAAGAALVLALPIIPPQVIRTEAVPEAVDRRASRVETLHLVLRNGTETDVDVGEPGFGPGDYNLKADEVFQGDRPLGRSTQQCTIVRMDPEPEPDVLLHCTITFMLTKGQVTVQGSFDVATFPPTLAVTGGTGRYQGVWGELAETEGEGDSTTLDLRLHHPRR
jgi:hypothetical protein